MKLNPIGEWVVIEPIEENITPGGIHLPQKTAEKATKGRVLEVGPGLKHNARSPDLS
jgi:co-chaperonin GroES (HSP10)